MSLFPRLDWSDDGVPKSPQFGDIYFSSENGLAESRAVFLNGCGLPQGWSGKPHFQVAELGFGTGLNIVALMDLWRRERRGGGHLHIFSIEAFPLTVEEAARALAPFTEVAASARALLAVWPPPVWGRHRVSPQGWDLTLDLHVGDVSDALASWDGLANAWFLDGFAPSANPAMWSQDTLQAVADHSAPAARLATFTVAGAVRRTLASVGFSVAKVPGHGRKRERLEATYRGETPLPSPVPTVAIVGAGIAGASVAQALITRGIKPTIFEARHPGAGASGFPAALVTPRLDAGDEGLATLAAQAVRRAMAQYSQIRSAVLHNGVLQLPSQNRRSDRFERIAGQSVWAEGEMELVDPASLDLDVSPTDLGPSLNMVLAGAIQPHIVLNAWLVGATMVRASVQGLERASSGGWQVLDKAGASLGNFDDVVLAAGDGCRHMTLDERPLNLNLSPVAGQADWIEAGAPTLRSPVAWGGYVIPFGASGLLFGATHERGEDRIEVTAQATHHNLARLQDRLPDVGGQVATTPVFQSRAAVRAVTPDRLPLVGGVPHQPGVHILSGLGSRGFAWAPLLAEQLVAGMLDLPRPLTRAQAQRLSPARDLPMPD